MKIRAAVLNAIGAKAPYAESKPLTIEEVELARRVMAKCWSRSPPPVFVTPICP